MRLKLTKSNLRFASAFMLAIAVAAVLLSVLLPINPPASSTDIAIQAPFIGPPSTQVAANSELFSELMDVDLRKPLVDPLHKTSPSTLANGDATFGLRLTGTIIEPMHSYAIFTDAGGKSEIKSVGDKAGGADIAEITLDSVTLLFPGRSMVLHTIKPPTIGGLGL